MPFEEPTKKPFLLLLLLGTLGTAAAGCAGETSKVVAEAAGMATTAQEPKPFVQETRPADPAYMPIGRTFPVQPLCQGETAPPPFVPGGQAAHFVFAPTPAGKAAENCKPRAAFKKIEAELDAKRAANEAAGTQAKSLGATPPPKPALLPTN